MKIKQIQKTHQQQHDQADCGVVCLKSILNFYNSDAPLEKLRALSGTYKTGTTLLGLMQCANKIGFTAEGFEADIASLKECTDTCILHILKDKVLQHYVVYYGYDSTTQLFLICDPAKKKPQYLSENELVEIWQSKALLLLKPTDNLPNKEKKNQLKWLISSLKEDTNILSMALILGVIIAVLGLSSAIFSQKFIDVLLPTNDFKKIIFGSLLLLFLLLVNGFFGYLQQLFLIRQGKDYNIRIINFFYSKLLNLPKLFFDTRKIGDLVARMNDTNRIQSTVTNFVSNIIVNFLMVITTSVAIFMYDYKLGLVSLLWIPIFLVIVLFYHPKILKSQKLVMQSYAQNESNYIDSITGINDIKSNNKQNNFTEQTNTIYSNYKENGYLLGKIGIQYQFVIGTVASLFIVALIVLASHLVITNNFTSGGVIAVLQLSSMLMGSLGGLAMLNIQLQEAKVALNRMFEYTSLDEEENSSETKIEELEIVSIELEDVTFGYAGREKILKNISLKLNKGECLGIGGEIGSGKSTLLQLLQKNYQPNIGSITVNKGIELDDIKTSYWRNFLGVVSQQTHIFTGNVFYNITLNNDYNPEAIVAFCKSFGFDIFITTFPQSYYTIIGEEGINLSGGQRQIIAFARALFKKPKLLLLDEVTASMDTKTEKFVLDILEKIKPETLMVIISHKNDILSKIADKTITI
jgi:ATP-binding cassette subfamily B protein